MLKAQANPFPLLAQSLAPDYQIFPERREQFAGALAVFAVIIS
jgi:hypothetical protein